MPNYTKGDWEAEQDEEGFWNVVADGDILIANCMGGNPEADAFLIAAAPRMYEALKAILVDAKNSQYTSLTRATRGLIDKALALEESNTGRNR